MGLVVDEPHRVQGVCRLSSQRLRNLARESVVSLQYFVFSFLFNEQYFISPESWGFTIDSTGTISTATTLDFERGVRR